MKKNIASVIGGAAVIAAAAISMTTGLAPASAAPVEGNLFIAQDSANPANFRLAVFGTFRMDGHDAHGFVNNLNTGARPGGMRYEIYGFDYDGADDAIGPDYWFPGARNEPEGYLYASDNGIHYRREISVPKSLLNEDGGIFADEGDEIYVRAIFVDGDGGTREQRSNDVTGEF